ncbi:hypothetical protein BFRIPA_00157 (plasmid) [Peribacillus frigoritolerans]
MLKVILFYRGNNNNNINYTLHFPDILSVRFYLNITH